MDSLAPKLRLREQFRSVMRLNHYSIRTEKSYWYWIRYFIRFHGMRHPLELGTSDVNAFLSWCQWPLILTHFWPIKLTHLGTANRQFSASADSSHLPA